MPFFAFRLDNIHVTYQRGRLIDNDLVTFSVLVNQIERGASAGVFNGMSTGSDNPARAVTPTVVRPRVRVDPDWRNGPNRDWIIGPLEIAPGDGISVVYSGFNTSDSELTDQDAEALEVKILDTAVSAAVGLVGGPVGSIVSGALGFVGDPVGKWLGWKKQGPCNGLVFAGAVDFTAAGLANLPFRQPPAPDSYVSLPKATEASFTRSYTDEANHDTGTCGHVAETDVTFSVLQVPQVSVSYYARMIYGSHDLSKGLRQVTPGAASAKSLLQLRP